MRNLGQIERRKINDESTAAFSRRGATFPASTQQRDPSSPFSLFSISAAAERPLGPSESAAAGVEINL